jgi:DNA-binding NtrC family response regulator
MKEHAHILVADDEEVIREACDRILKRLGHQVALAVDGGQAARLIEAQTFHLIILDIKMPVMDGMDVLKMSVQIQPRTPVVVITGHGTAKTAHDALSAGALIVLTKPFSPVELRKAVADALARA